MGVSTFDSATGKPIFNSTPATQSDLQSAADFAEKMRITSVATVNDLDSIPFKFPGMTRLVDAGKSIHMWSGDTWIPVRQDTGWITPTLSSGWSHQPSETFQYRRVDGWVCFRGRFLTGSPASTTVFTLPVGFRPDGYANNIFSIYPSPRRAVISSTGAVVTDSVGELVSFGNVTFRGV